MTGNETAAPDPTRMAVITGGSSGLGLAIAEAFGSLGWRVAVGARSPRRLTDAAAAVERAGGTAFTQVLDVTDGASITEFYDAAEAALGPVEVLVNNAAVGEPALLHEMSSAHIRREVDTALTGSLFMSARAIASMRRSGTQGDIVFLTSDSAVHEWPAHIPYAAAKAGMEHASRTLRVELEGTGIRSQFVRVGIAGPTDFSAGWDPARKEAAYALWARLGLRRHSGKIGLANVARAVVSMVCAERTAIIDGLSISANPPVL